MLLGDAEGGPLMLILLKAGDDRNIRGVLDYVLKGLIALVFLYTLWVNITLDLQPYVRNVGFLSLTLIGLFIMKSPFKGVAVNKIGFYDFVIIALIIYIGSYIYFNGDTYVNRFPLVTPLTTHEMVIGILIILIGLEAIRRSLGAIFTSLILLALAHFFFGHLLPGLFRHKEKNLMEFIDHMVYTINGIHGSIAGVVATYVIIFVLFGAFLQVSGAGDFFINFAKSVAGKSRGGEAKISVVSSAMFGTISGSPVSDVLTTGSFTIPMMKKAKYPAAYAGAVEAAASSGGSIMPPVMGTAALLMTEIAGVPLTQVILAAIIPALLYYGSIFAQVHFRAVKMNLIPPKEKMPNIGQVIIRDGYFFIPFGFLVYLLLQGYTPQYAAIWSILIVIVLSWVKKHTRMGPKRIFEAIELGIRRLLPLTAIVIGAGLLVGIINITGLGTKVLSLIAHISGGSIFIALLLTAVICIFLGMGMPTAAAYVLTAVLTAPTLIGLGVGVLQAHLFIVYFTILSAITPPICVAAYAASTIAEANPIDIGFKALRLGVAAYIVPFIFVFQPAINLIEGDLLTILITSISTFIGIILLGSAIEGILLKSLTWYERIWFLVGAAFLFFPSLTTDIIGYLIIIPAFLWHIFRKPTNQLPNLDLDNEKS